MARANLPLHGDLDAAFTAAQDTGSATRFLKVLIADESLTLDMQGERVGTAAEDFAVMASTAVHSEEACLVLYCLSDESGESVFNSGAAKKWCLICFIPESCNVRDKMLYSACREDIKETLGRPLFGRDYGANTLQEMTWEALGGDASHDKSIYESEKERVTKESDAASDAERSGVVKSNVIAMLPFDFTDDVTTALKTLQNNMASAKDVIFILELYLHDEVISLTTTDAASEAGKGEGAQEVPMGSVSSVAPFINSEHGHFYVIHIPCRPSPTARPDASGEDGASASILSGTFFVFSCPESTPVRMRMTLSSSKSTVMAKLDELGLRFTKVFEIREPADIDEHLSVPSAADAAAAAGAGAGSAAAEAVTHARPAARGRASTKKVSKFVAD